MRRFNRTGDRKRRLGNETYQEEVLKRKALDDQRKAEAEKLERENKDVVRRLRQGKPGDLTPRQIDKFRDLLSEQQKEKLQEAIKNRPKDPEKKFKDNPQDRFGKFRTGEAKKGGLMKDIMGDKKGRVIYKGKAKDYKMIIPIEPPSTPSEATSKMKKMKGGMVRVKTRLGRTKPTKIY